MQRFYDLFSDRKCVTGVVMSEVMSKGNNLESLMQLFNSVSVLYVAYSDMGVEILAFGLIFFSQWGSGINASTLC